MISLKTTTLSARLVGAAADKGKTTVVSPPIPACRQGAGKRAGTKKRGRRGTSMRQRQFFPQHCLYFFPLPHGQGSFRPTLGPTRTGLAFSTRAAASLTISLPRGGPGLAEAALGPVDVPVVVPPKALVDWWVV